ncbi:methyltransferase domain-containing protein [Streptomyces sp. NBC_00996]|uniref:class I SAM-dependent methyltransferase n=1 Tax=Streptomyces sp. NBC_00996 TaxID=2903710 RepID=UPI00386D43FB|nr:methyltransferase domain-containing protein [Streptomyces sp. NBC_00996]
MTVRTDLPPALRRATELLAVRGIDPLVQDGYLDTLRQPPGSIADAESAGIQAFWASKAGAGFYQFAQALVRAVLKGSRTPTEWLVLPSKGVILDVGSGLGHVTGVLADSAGGDVVVLGVDISAPMLARAARACTDSRVGFLLADAGRLPFDDGCVDGVVSTAVLQLVADRAAALAEMVRVLRPGGVLTVMIPSTKHGPAKLMSALPGGGVHYFDDDELPGMLAAHGLTDVHVRRKGSFQWVRGAKSPAAGIAPVR